MEFKLATNIKKVVADFLLICFCVHGLNEAARQMVIWYFIKVSFYYALVISLKINKANFSEICYQLSYSLFFIIFIL